MVRWMIVFLMGCAIAPAAVAIASMGVAGRSGIEKAITRFFQPDAFFWAVLTGFLVASLWERRRPSSGDSEETAGADESTRSKRARDRWSLSSTSILLILWLVYTVSGSSFLSGWLNYRLEAPYLETRPLQSEVIYDRVIVLGGSTKTGGNGEAGLTASGDRVMLTARLFQTGKTKRIVVTGLPIEGLSRPGAATPAEETIEILLDLGVPRDAIDVVGGRNTSEELKELKKLLSGQSERLGLVTSAWHLGRAMRLAKSVGLEIDPLPADFRTGDGIITPMSFIPSTQSAADTAAAIKEFLAGWLGR